jgi:2,4-dienoyl-CoA reductase-like NADH-dependent reductase (Old Yellow Enzyme family)
VSSPALFQPFSCRSVTFANRIIVAPMCQYAAEEGHVGRWHRAHHSRFSLGGVGGAIVEATAVLRDGRITPGCLGIWDDAHVEGLAEIVGLYHDHAIPVGIQLAHAGRKGSAAVPFEGAQPLPADDPRAWLSVAPSALPFGEKWQTPKALDEAGIAEVIGAFADSAKRAVAAGFDFLEIHGAHGYLVNSFMSPIANQRDDGWGGSRERRFRFAVEIACAVRAVVPSSMPLFFRTSSVDGVPGGIEIEDSVVLARMLKAEGVDLIDCSSGGIATASGLAGTRPSPGYLVPYAAQIRREADIATMAVGLIMSPEQAEAVVASGDADLVAMGRELLADSNFPHRAAVALGLENPHQVLPREFSFYLDRRRWE